MTFGQAVGSCFSNYVNFSGRAPRSEYWYWVLFAVIGGLLTGFIDGMMGNAEVMLINGIFNLAVLLPGLAVAVRRLHDINKSGWWLLLYITVIGGLVVLYWHVQPSVEEDNQYAKDNAIED